jgi:hypothetical protein
MEHISGFFSRYLSPYFKQERIKESVARICSDVIGVSIQSKDISIRSGVCSIQGSQGLKHQLFIHKQEILKQFQDVKELAHLSFG